MDSPDPGSFLSIPPLFFISLFLDFSVSAVFSLYPRPDSLALCFSALRLAAWGAVDGWERVPGDREGSCDWCSLHPVTSFSLSICF